MPKGIYDHSKLRGSTYEEIHGIEEANRLRKLRSASVKKRGRIWSVHPKGMLGKLHTKEWREQHSRDMSGKNHPLYKKGHSEMTRVKISRIRREKGLAVLKNNPNWKGGISFNPYGAEFDKELKLFIRQRDDYTCQFCGVVENGRAFPPHHINYNKEDNDGCNFILLCGSCNTRANSNREKWELCFTILNEIRRRSED